MTSSITTPNRPSSSTTQNRPASGTANTNNTQPAEKPQSQPTTTSVKTVDASVRTQDGRDVKGYGLDLNRDNRYDGAQDGVLAFDFDKNGDLSDKEVKDTRDGLQAFSGNNDLDNNGGVDEQEKATADRLAGLVRQFDANNDGKLNNQELKAAGAGVITGDGVQALDEITAGDSKASLKELDPKNASAVLDMLGGANDPQNEKPAADAPADAAAPADAGAAPAGAPAAGGPSSPKGPTVANPDAPAGFLWKPSSDSDGNLVILLPPNYAGKVQSVKVLSPDGQVLDEGKFSGVGNGDRPHFRFKKPGASFPNGSQVEITMNDGTKQTITIDNTSVRNEGTGKGK